jgi:hypothetical protein
MGRPRSGRALEDTVKSIHFNMSCLLGFQVSMLWR